MLDILEKEIRAFKTREEKFNHLRELLQILLLKIIDEAGLFKNLVFGGGTALRILFDLRRFSEDLDFSLINKRGYKLEKFDNILRKKLRQYNLEAEIKLRNKKIVQELQIKFRKILFDLGLSDFGEQKLFIKIEIDTNPPSGGKWEISLVNKLFFFNLVHFDIPSLYATKLHACFFRKYTKGRDFYDLLWYLSRKIEPNYKLLNNAIAQTHKGESSIERNNFKKFLLDRIAKVDFEKVRKDVEKFLEDKREVEFLRPQTFLNLIEKLNF